MDQISGLLSALEKMAGPPEEIDGANVKETANVVDLSIAYSPVVCSRCDEFQRWIPETEKPQKDGLRYYVLRPQSRDWLWISPDELKVMRARFLLMKAVFYKMFRGYSYPDRQKILHYYFDGRMWQPKEDSDLAKAMGLQ